MYNTARCSTVCCRMLALQSRSQTSTNQTILQQTSSSPAILCNRQLNIQYACYVSVRKAHSEAVQHEEKEDSMLLLKRLHKKTIERYGSCSRLNKEPVSRSRPSSESTQIRRQPQFAKEGVPLNQRWYFCQTVSKTGSRQLIRYRMNPSEEVVIADRLEASCRVKEAVPSESGIHAALLVSSDSFGSAFIIHEQTGELLTVLERAHQVQWVSDTELYYTTISTDMRPDMVLYVDIAQKKQPQLVYRSVYPDEVVSLGKTKDGTYLTVYVNTKLQSEVLLRDLGHSEGKLQTLCARDQGIKCYVEHLNGSLVSVNNTATSPNLHINYSAPLDRSTIPNINQFSEHPESFGVIHDFEVFERGVAVYHTNLDTGNWRVSLLDPGNLETIKATIDFPDDISLVEPNGNTSFYQTRLHMKAHSLTKPMKELVIPFSKFKVSRGKLISRGNYEVWRANAPSGDTTIPLTIIGKEETLNASTPCLFTVYGCYGTSLCETYESLPKDLLDRGWKVVLCHVRGGGERGLQWYQQGMGSYKMNSIRDTVACITHVQDALSLTTPTESVLQATSSGALVAARAIQTSPGIVGKLVLRMPFLDLTTAMEHDHPLSKEERMEWCDDDDQHRDLCPCSNAAPLGCDIYMTVGSADRRTPPWHAANFLSSPVEGGAAQTHVHLLDGADHEGFDEKAYRLEMEFILDQKSKGSGLWKKLRDFLPR